MLFPNQRMTWLARRGSQLPVVYLDHAGDNCIPGGEAAVDFGSDWGIWTGYRFRTRSTYAE